MAKSTINSLQEMSIKQGFTKLPDYKFTEKRLDGTTIQFTCNVFCNVTRSRQFKACGTGTSKKEAKHNAAENMLLLLDTNHEAPLPIDNLSSSSVANITHSPEKVYETSSPNEESTVDRNYVGLLQEFCQQQKIPTSNILYKLIYEEGPFPMKTFTMEVTVGSLRERAMASCKKAAKQQAARKLLLRVNPNETLGQEEVLGKEMLELENNIRKLGTGILDCVTNKETIAELTEKAKLLYVERTKKSYGIIDQTTNPLAINNLHNLFEKNYSSKIQDSLREKMRIIQNKYTDETDLWQIRCDIESSLNVKIQQITVHSKMKDHIIIYLRLPSNPCITQFGKGETKFIAQSRAMYNLVTAILILLNV
ncbi:uncharacterized protein LOC112468057 isoform X2 [Temnothorax curvispinosus]|uniref:Uncharacterized protein LOC112468057 isoform X2 n=1 Tax=Temnothorax curvispinosus TaxID=300111 RepID=A0A6J1RD31_9HYME|nr:uncharacterized protein LOC112468057 isoform X2 [Temnothorax curvispinosus]